MLEIYVFCNININLMEKLHEKCVFFNQKKTSLARKAVRRHLGLKTVFGPDHYDTGRFSTCQQQRAGFM